MREPDRSGFDVIEERLAARGSRATPGYRDRVLAAVRDTLDRRPGPPPRAGAGIDGGRAAVLLALTLSALLAVVAPWLVVARAVSRVPMEPRLVAQARAAGIDLPLEFVATTTHRSPPTVSRMREPPSARLREAWHLRNLLTGEL